MTKTLSAAEANQGFSNMLRQVQQGEDFIVLSRGRAVARVVPYVDEPNSAKLAEIVAELRQLPERDLPDWTRDDLY
ncbi:MAG: hypothetical protein RL186_1220 [Pseudomonadota bacterium]|jgi:prevent-host-death family protein